MKNFRTALFSVRNRLTQQNKKIKIAAKKNQKLPYKILNQQK